MFLRLRAVGLKPEKRIARVPAAVSVSPPECSERGPHSPSPLKSIAAAAKSAPAGKPAKFSPPTKDADVAKVDKTVLDLAKPSRSERDSMKPPMSS